MRLTCVCTLSPSQSSRKCERLSLPDESSDSRFCPFKRRSKPRLPDPRVVAAAEPVVWEVELVALEAVPEASVVLAVVQAVWEVVQAAVLAVLVVAPAVSVDSAVAPEVPVLAEVVVVLAVMAAVLVDPVDTKHEDYSFPKIPTKPRPYPKSFSPSPSNRVFLVTHFVSSPFNDVFITVIMSVPHRFNSLIYLFLFNSIIINCLQLKY